MTIETLTIIIIGVFITLPIILVLILINEINKQKRPKTKYKVRTRKPFIVQNNPSDPSRKPNEETIVLFCFQCLGVTAFIGRSLIVYYGFPTTFAYAFAFILVCLVVFLFDQGNRQQPLSQNSNFTSLQDCNLNSLQIYLVQLVHGDTPTAMRLVDYERSRYPGKTEEWYWKSAIERLIRDRR